MQLQFLIDATDYGHPINWRDVKIRYERDKSIHGLFTIYSSELQFTGAAYKHLFNKFQADVCYQADIVINQRCSRFESWSQIIEGVFILSDAKWDDQLCSVTVPIEQDACIPELMKVIAKKIPFPSRTCIDGTTSCALTTRQITQIQLYDGTLYNTLGFPDNYGWNIGDIFEFMVKYLSNDCISFESDFFSTPINYCQVEIEITVNPAIGDVVKLVLYDEILLQETTYRVKVTVGWQQIFADLTNVCYIAGVSKHIPNEYLLNSFNSAYVPGAPDKIILKFWSQKTVVSISAGTGTATATVTQDYQLGGLDAVMSSSGSLTNETKWQFESMSFVDMFHLVSNYFDLAIQFVDTGGGYALKMERIGDIYNAVASPTIRNIKNVIKTERTDQIGKTLTGHMKESPQVTYSSYNMPFAGTPDIDQASIQGIMFRETDMPGCISTVERRVADETYIDFGALFDVTASLQDDIGNYFFMYFADKATDVFYPFEYKVFDAILFSGYYFPVYKNMIAYQDVLFYYLMKDSRPEIHFDSFPLTYLYEYNAGVYSASTTSSGTNTWPAGIAWNPILWSFERYISADEWAAIVATNQIAINQGDDPVDDVNAFIRMVEYRLGDGLAKFELEAKS